MSFQLSTPRIVRALQKGEEGGDNFAGHGRRKNYENVVPKDDEELGEGEENKAPICRNRDEEQRVLSPPPRPRPRADEKHRVAIQQVF